MRPHDTEERWGGPPAGPTRDWSALGLTFAHGAWGVRSWPLAPVLAIAESFGERKGFGVGLQVGGSELDLVVKA